MSQFSQSQTRQQSIFSQTGSQSTLRSSKGHHPTCPRCGSRKWRRDPNRGVVVCAEGHVLEGFLRESTEQTEASQYSLRKRRLSAAPRQRKSYIGKSAYQDQRARILLVQALTLLIRKQIEALVQIISAPTQLEEITQTLWKAYLSALDLDDHLFTAEDRSLSPAIPSSRFGDDSQSAGYSSQEDPDSSHPTTPRRPTDPLLQTGTPQNKDQLTTPEALKAITQNHAESSDDDSSTDSASSSSSSNHGLQQKKPTRKKTPKSHHRTHPENIKIHPRMVVTICTIYLACLKLRLPIILQDLINFITTKQVPHIGFIHSIPTEVQKKMNRPVMQSLSAEKPPRLFARRGHSSGLVNVCRQLLKIFQDANPSVLLPENTTPNLSLLVLRFSKVLLLPDPLQLLALNLVRRLDPYFLTLSVLSCGKAQSSMGAVSAKTTTTVANRRGGSASGNKALTMFRMQMAKYPPEWFIMAVVYIVAQSAIVASCSNLPRRSASASSDDDDKDDHNYDDDENDDENEEEEEEEGGGDGRAGGGGDNSVADQKQEEIDQQIRRLVSQFLPQRDQWYQDLTHKIKLDGDQNPQTLWEKNLTELDSKEIDSYVAFAKEFLLKDQPEPNDISFKNQFFPLASSTRADANGDVEMDEAGLNDRARETGIRGRSNHLQDDSSDLTEDQSGDNQNKNKYKKKKSHDETNKQEIDKLLNQLLVTRGSELVGCSLSNHSHLEEFVKVYVFVDSFLSKKI